MSLRVKYILLVLVAFLAFSAKADTSAAEILAGIRKAVFAKPSVEILFTLTSEGSSTQGSAKMQGAMFTFTTPQFMAWYDGTTQWAMQRKSSEVNISEPTTDEIMALNPFGILAEPSTYYSMTKLKGTASECSVKLTPKAKGTGIENIVITCARKGYSPKSIVITFDDHRRMTMTVDGLIPGEKFPTSAFRYDQKLYPAKEIIDLR